MSSSDIQQLLDLCSAVKDKIPQSSHWDYDDRFMSALIVFPAAEKDSFMSALKKTFRDEWDHKSIKKAPKPVKKIVKSMAGISSGQMLFTGDEKDTAVFYAMWWPWGDGTKISLRIGIYHEEKDKINPDEIKKSFAEWLDSQKIK